MHGDIGQPNAVVLLKDDYEIYDKKNELFVKKLQGDLLSNTFLFIGFSFDDPNLENILSKVSSTTLIYLKTLNTLSNFYSLVGREQEYEANYSHLMELYQTKNLDHQEFLFGYIRVRYNYAHYLVSKEKYNEAVQEALETIEICKDRQTSYQLAPLLILVGNAGAQFLDKEQVKNYYIEARELCKIYNNPLMLMKIENYLKKLDSI